jgi:hypothetical protein
MPAQLQHYNKILGLQGRHNSILHSRFANSEWMTTARSDLGCYWVPCRATTTIMNVPGLVLGPPFEPGLGSSNSEVGM